MEKATVENSTAVPLKMELWSSSPPLDVYTWRKGNQGLEEISALQCSLWYFSQ